MTESDFQDALKFWVNSYFRNNGWLNAPQTKSGLNMILRDASAYADRLRASGGLPPGKSVLVQLRLEDGDLLVNVPDYFVTMATGESI